MRQCKKSVDFSAPESDKERIDLNLINGINIYMEAEKTSEDWWTEKNTLLFHAINFGADPKGDYKLLHHKPLPDRGEINVSIVNPFLPVAYGDWGLILKPVTPVRMSYTDVGSFADPDNIEKRLSKGPMWTPRQMTQRQLLYLTLAGGCYNEVHVKSEETAVEGILGYSDSVDEFVDDTITYALKDHAAGKPYISHVNAHLLSFPGTKLYGKKEFCRDLHVRRWAIMDQFKKGYEPLSFYEFRDGILSGNVRMEDVLVKGGINEEMLIRGSITLQQITEEHRRRVIEELPMLFPKQR